VNFWQFRAATHISRVNCTEMAEDRPRQPAHKIFSIEWRYSTPKFRPHMFNEACTLGCQRKVPPKSGYWLFIRCCLV